MDIEKFRSKKIFSTCEDAHITEYKNFIIIILLTLLILAFLGINVCGFITDVASYCLEPIYNVIRNVLYMFGFSVGGAINNVSDVVSDGAKIGIDIADGTVQDAADLLIKVTDKDSDEEIARRKLEEKEKKDRKCERFSLYSEPFDEMLNKSTVVTRGPNSQELNDEWCSIDAKDSIQSNRNCKSFVKYSISK